MISPLPHIQCLLFLDTNGVSNNSVHFLTLSTQSQHKTHRLRAQFHKTLSTLEASCSPHKLGTHIPDQPTRSWGFPQASSQIWQFVRTTHRTQENTSLMLTMCYKEHNNRNTQMKDMHRAGQRGRGTRLPCPLWVHTASTSMCAPVWKLPRPNPSGIFMAASFHRHG